MTGRLSRVFSPPTDVIELDDRLIVLIEVAGVRPDDISILLADGRLTVSGVRPRPHLQHTRSTPAYHQLEIGYGEFRVEVMLPWPIRRERALAAYEDGFLQIELARQAETPIHVVRTERRTETTTFHIGFVDDTHDHS